MDYKDINSELCIKCGECCRIIIPIYPPYTRIDDRYLEFCRGVGLNIFVEKHNKNRLTIDLGYCEKLEILDGFYKCKIYDRRPQLCKDYNCLAWANVSNIKEESRNLIHAMKIYKEIVECSKMIDIV